jgi:DNA invertase Pin-like site-specific DNA recombinase
MDNSATNTHRHTVIFVRAGRADALDRLRGEEQVLRRRLTEAGIDHADAVVIADVGSGRSLGRPALRRLFQMLEAGEVGVLATPSLTRLARRLEVRDLVRKLEGHGARLVLADGLVRVDAMSVIAFVHEMANEAMALRLRCGRAARRL